MFRGFGCLTTLLLTSMLSVHGQAPATWEWRTYGADLASRRYAPLDQINAANFNKLEVAWRLKTDNFGNRPEFKLEGTPLMVNGVLYTTAGTRRSVIALDAKTGRLVPEFGQGGFVDMGTQMASPASVYKDVLITPQSRPVIRAWSARTGEALWTFHLIAQPGDPTGVLRSMEDAFAFASRRIWAAVFDPSSRIARASAIPDG